MPGPLGQALWAQALPLGLWPLWAFLDSNIESISKIELKQNIKFTKVFESNVKHNPSDIIYNFSSRTELFRVIEYSILIRFRHNIVRVKKQNKEVVMNDTHGRK